MPALRMTLMSAALSLTVTEPLHAGSIEPIMQALLACNPVFFDRLKENKTSLGPVSIKPHDDPNATSTDPDATRVEGIVATLDQPAAASGLHVTQYSQVVLTNSGRVSTYWWGFHVTEKPADAVTTLKALSKDADFEQQDDQFGWVQELDPTWRHLDNSAVETQVPWRMVLVEPGEADGQGSEIRCGVFKEAAGDLKALPKPEEILVVH